MIPIAIVLGLVRSVLAVIEFVVRKLAGKDAVLNPKLYLSHNSYFYMKVAINLI